MPGQVDQPLGVREAAGNVIALNKWYVQPTQKGTGYSPPESENSGLSNFGNQRRPVDR